MDRNAMETELCHDPFALMVWKRGRSCFSPMLTYTHSLTKHQYKRQKKLPLSLSRYKKLRERKKSRERRRKQIEVKEENSRSRARQGERKAKAAKLKQKQASEPRVTLTHFGFSPSHTVSELVEIFPYNSPYLSLSAPQLACNMYPYPMPLFI